MIGSVIRSTFSDRWRHIFLNRPANFKIRSQPNYHLVSQSSAELFLMNYIKNKRQKYDTTINETKHLLFTNIFTLFTLAYIPFYRSKIHFKEKHEPNREYQARGEKKTRDRKKENWVGASSRSRFLVLYSHALWVGHSSKCSLCELQLLC